MNMESENQPAEAPVAPARPASNPGDRLRQVREARGLSLERVSEELNLTAAVVGYIERGEFDRLPGHTFARGYIRTYARLLELDQAELVDEFDRFTGTDASGSQVKNLNRIHEPSSLPKIILRLVSALLLLGLVLAGYYLWQETPQQLGRFGNLGLRHIEVEKADGGTEVHNIDGQLPLSNGGSIGLPLGNGGSTATTLPVPEQQPAAQAEETTPEAATEEAQPVVAPAAEPVVAPAPAPAPAAQTEVRQPLALNAARPAVPTGRVSLAAIDNLGPRSTPLSLQVPESQRVTPPAPEPVKPAVPAGHGLLQISFSEDCWLKVTDRTGRTQFSGIKRKGETLELTARAPIGLHLGNAGGAQVRFNGEPVGTGQVSSGGTARLTLGQ